MRHSDTQQSKSSHALKAASIKLISWNNLAGDFNTMTSISYSRLKEIVSSLGMSEVTIEKQFDNRVRSVLGQYYDIIFYKQLEVVNSHSIDLKTTKNGKSSDHNTLFAEFKLAAEK